MGRRSRRRGHGERRGARPDELLEIQFNLDVVREHLAREPEPMSSDAPFSEIELACAVAGDEGAELREWFYGDLLPMLLRRSGVGVPAGATDADLDDLLRRELIDPGVLPDAESRKGTPQATLPPRELLMLTARYSAAYGNVGGAVTLAHWTIMAAEEGEFGELRTNPDRHDEWSRVSATSKISQIELHLTDATGTIIKAVASRVDDDGDDAAPDTEFEESWGRACLDALLALRDVLATPAIA